MIDFYSCDGPPHPEDNFDFYSLDWGTEKDLLHIFEKRLKDYYSHFDILEKSYNSKINWTENICIKEEEIEYTILKIGDNFKIFGDWSYWKKEMSNYKGESIKIYKQYGYSTNGGLCSGFTALLFEYIVP